MTRKDYVLIATVMLYAKPGELHPKSSAEAKTAHAYGVQIWRRATEEFARVLAGGNFDRTRFLSACGYEE